MKTRDLRGRGGRIDWAAVRVRLAEAGHALEGVPGHGDRAEVLQRRADAFAARRPAGGAGGARGGLEHLLFFASGGRRLAIAAAAVMEIARTAEAGLTPLPGAPPGVAGLANLRGAILAVVDPAALAGSETARRAPAYLVRLRPEDLRTALGVDVVEDVRAVARAEIKPLAAGGPFFRGSLDGGVDVLDPGALLPGAFPRG